MVKRSGKHWVFELIRPGAREVFLVGDFNGWSCGSTPMKRNDAGLWEQVLLLTPGVYRFRYYADGQWLTDYAAYGVQRNPLGDYDSVLLVEEVADTVVRNDEAGTSLPAKAMGGTHRRMMRGSVVKIEVPPAATGRHVALAAARQRRLASGSPVDIERIVTSMHDSRELAEV